VTHEHGIRTERHGPYTLRPARAADLEQLVDLLLALQDHIESSNADLWRMKRDARHNLKGQVSGRLEAANSCALVAEHVEDGVVGLIFGRIIVNNRYTPSRAGQIDQAFVRPDPQTPGGWVSARGWWRGFAASLPLKAWRRSRSATSPATRRRLPSGRHSASHSGS